MTHIHAGERVVHWGDCSPSSAVFYPTYFRWFDEATWGFLESAGLAVPDLTARYGLVGIPLLSTAAEFKGPCGLGDLLRIETRLDAVGESELALRHTILNGGRAAVIGREQRFWGLRREDRPRGLRRGTIPPEVAERLRALL